MLSRYGHRRHDGSWWFGLEQFGGSDLLMIWRAQLKENGGEVEFTQI